MPISAQDFYGAQAPPAAYESSPRPSPDASDAKRTTGGRQMPLATIEATGQATYRKSGKRGTRRRTGGKRGKNSKVGMRRQGR